MLILTFKKFNESSMFSFFKKKDDDRQSNRLIGKIVAVDTKIKSSDGYNLIHIYVIKDREGKIGKFMGNIRYRGETFHFRKSHLNITEPIDGWRELSPSETKLYNPR